MLTFDTNRLELVFKKLVLAFVALVSGQPHTYAQNEIANAESQSSLTLEEHKLFESRVRKVIHDVSPTVVAVESPLGGITKEIKHYHNHFINCGTGVIISSDGLVLSQWHVSAEPIGTFVVAPDPHGQPMLSGIVSVATRKIANCKKAEEIVAPGRTTIPASLDIFPYFDRPGVVVHHVRNDTAKKGLKNGDVILKIDDVDMTNPEEMHNYVSTLAGNQEVAITVRRNDEVQIYKVHFSPLPYFECPGAISPYANMRCDDFPEVFEHDIPLALNECGGPVVALDGRALGINIARVGDHGSMAIPASAIVAQVEKWKRFIDPTSVSAAASEDGRYAIPMVVVSLIFICGMGYTALCLWKKRNSAID